MKILFPTLTVAIMLTGCENNSSNENKQYEESIITLDKELGAFSGEDGDVAYDELSLVIKQLVKRNDELTSLQGFCSVDVPSVRANVVILTNLISSFNGGGEAISKMKLSHWSKVINETFTDSSKWGYKPWPEADKNAWRKACNEDLDILRRAVEEHWE